MIYKITIKHFHKEVEPFAIYAHPFWPVVLGPTGDPIEGWKVVFKLDEHVDRDADMTPVVFKEAPAFRDRYSQLIVRREGDPVPTDAAKHVVTHVTKIEVFKSITEVK